jgi:phosphatidate cytidylyltransferase
MNEEFGLLRLVGVVLVVSTVLALGLRWTPLAARQPALIQNIWDRIKAWWVMAAVLAGAVWGGLPVVVILFAGLSLFAVREMVQLVDLEAPDRRALVWIYGAVIPIQYGTILIDWYGLFVIFIPVYVSFFLNFRSAMGEISENFFERTAKLNTICLFGVYLLSYTPALLTLDLASGAPAVQLLLFALVMSQLGDVMQFVWGKAFGKRKLAPTLSPGKTIEGAVGGVLSVAAIAALVSSSTPFAPLVAAAFGGGMVCIGIMGGLILSAVKRDAGRKDWGDLIKGHGGVMDRLDSLIFAGPIFFHLVRFFMTK